MNTNQNDRINKIFLLVFHGGLVAYLILHNQLMPLVKNVGSGTFIFSDFQFYFIPQLFLWVYFYRITISRKNFDRLPFAISINIFILIFSAIIFLNELQDGISRVEFSRLISLGAIGIFFLGFFIYFKKFFTFKVPNIKKQYVLGIFLGIGFVLIDHGIVYDVLSKEKIIVENTITLKDKRKVEIPKEAVEIKKIYLASLTKHQTKIYFPSNKEIKLINNLNEKVFLRVEYIKLSKWYFKKLIVLNENETTFFTTDEKGIYRLRAPNSTNKISTIIWANNEKFKSGEYIVTQKGIEVNDE